MVKYRLNPTIYEVNTLLWLNQLREVYGSDLTLSRVPYEEWLRLKKQGFDYIWLMGVWKRSSKSREIAMNIDALKAQYSLALPEWKPEDVVGSPYAIQTYDVDPLLGRLEDLKEVRKILNELNIGLILDYVPNHVAIDHPWVFKHPDYFICVDAAEAERNPPHYTVVDLGSERVFIAHGRDPYFPPWTDTVQINIFCAEAREALIEVLELISSLCDGVRCDVAMLLLNDVFERTWGHLLKKLRFSRSGEEFWREAISRVKTLNPDFNMIAEVYWGLQDRLLDLGFDYVYDKDLYDSLFNEQLEALKRCTSINVSRQSRYVRFTENHDEIRAVNAFGRERSMAASLITYTTPSMRLFHQGQLEGRRIKAPLQLQRIKSEDVDEEIQRFYNDLLNLLNTNTLHNGDWRLLTVEGAQTVFGWIWEYDLESVLICVNYSGREAECSVKVDGLTNIPLNITPFFRKGATLIDAEKDYVRLRFEPYGFWLSRMVSHPPNQQNEG
ncbi:MAG: alpha-amylase family glycosyl hydrolase [Nitrososphaerales archaeon]